MAENGVLEMIQRLDCEDGQKTAAANSFHCLPSGRIPVFWSLISLLHNLTVNMTIALIPFLYHQKQLVTAFGIQLSLLIAVATLNAPADFPLNKRFWKFFKFRLQKIF